MFNQKKGSISISINMIVVVVLAFVMLGLMLGLGQQIINSAGETANQVSEQTKQDIVNKLTQSNEPLYFTQREFDVPFNKRQTLAFGVKNTAPQQKDLKVEIYPINDDGTESSTALSPSTDPSINTINNGGAFFWTRAPQLFQAGESKVFDVQYRAPSAQSTYMFKFKLVDEADMVIAEQIVFVNVI